jgi:hypothetical protein
VILLSQFTPRCRKAFFGVMNGTRERTRACEGSENCLPFLLVPPNLFIWEIQDLLAFGLYVVVNEQAPPWRGFQKEEYPPSES